jgi:DNA phosphorothioation-associated putative methyltransferase
MDFAAYKKVVSSLEFGKKLPDAIYLHESYLQSAPHELISFVSSVATTHGKDFEWNILKLYRRDFKVTLLSYPEFDDDNYPPLRASLTIDLVRSNIRKTSFSRSENPPILHRKETLVPSSHPLYDHFLEVTEEGEKAGLYETSRKIGFKKSWERVIAQKGYALIDGRIISRNKNAEALADSDESNIDIQRHLTAVDRDKLSTPMQSLARHGYLDGEHSILDYGCGKGHDLLELEAHGLDVIGWDPAYRPDGIKRPSDIVNLGFVINVIEDRQERAQCLSAAYSLAKQFLVVSVMLGGEATTQKFTPYKDGVVTSRGTFQKYFTQAELRDFIESTIQAKAVAVGPGLFYVFKDEIAEQEFLVTRQRVKREWKQLVQRDRLSPSVDHQAIIEKNLDLFRDFWATCLDFGRPPANDEFEQTEEIRRLIGSHRKALNASKEYFGGEDYDAAKIGRKKDLTVFLALSFFDRHRAYSRMPISLQRDIRAFFEKPSAAYDFAKEALFAIANTEMIGIACENAFKKIGCGDLKQDQSFTFAATLLDRLPPILRIYVGCATQLYGDIDLVHLIKIHITSGKVSLMIYDDFEKPLPILKERIKIRMRDQFVDFFFYTAEYEQQPLYFKSMYLQPSHTEFLAQRKFDQRLIKTGIDLSGFGPNLSDLNTFLAHKRFRIPKSL